MEKKAEPMSTWRARRKDAGPAAKNLAPRKAPTGKPMKRRSKKSEGMMKKLRSLNRARVKSTVEKERLKRQAPSASGEGSGAWDLPGAADVRGRSRTFGGRGLMAEP